MSEQLSSPRNRNVSFENPLSGGYQTFKKVFGLALIVLALTLGLKIMQTALNLVSSKDEILKVEFIRQLIPIDPELRTIKMTINAADGNNAVSAVEIPERLLVFAALTICSLLGFLMISFLSVIMRCGTALMRDDVNYVLKRIRQEFTRQD